MTDFSKYFTRNLDLLTPAQQQYLLKARVAVIGCGGLGGYVIEELTRIGLGSLHLVDPDVFSKSNCNRQLYALQSTMGKGKADTAAQRTKAIGPWCRATPYAADFRELPEAEVFAVDAVVDCLDDIQGRRDLARLTDRLGLPLIHGAVSGWYGQVGVHRPGTDLIGRLYPESTDKKKNAPSVLSCTVALVASLQALETVKILLSLDSPLQNGWLHIDLKESEFLLMPL